MMVMFPHRVMTGRRMRRRASAPKERGTASSGRIPRPRGCLKRREGRAQLETPFFYMEDGLNYTRVARPAPRVAAWRGREWARRPRQWAASSTGTTWGSNQPGVSVFIQTSLHTFKSLPCPVWQGRRLAPSAPSLLPQHCSREFRKKVEERNEDCS